MTPMTRLDRYIDCRKTVAAFNCSVDVDILLLEMKTRSPRWLNEGIKPDVTFGSAELERRIRENRPHEIRTARRLNSVGLPTEFQEDAHHYHDEKTGFDQRIGLADFKNGYEIKTLSGASRESTIDSYLRKVAKKVGVIAVVFNNTENDAMDDESLIEIIKRSRRYAGRIYVLTKSGEYLRIK